MRSDCQVIRVVTGDQWGPSSNGASGFFQHFVECFCPGENSPLSSAKGRSTQRASNSSPAGLESSLKFRGREEGIACGERLYCKSTITR